MQLWPPKHPQSMPRPLRTFLYTRCMTSRAAGRKSAISALEKDQSTQETPPGFKQPPAATPHPECLSCLLDVDLPTCAAVLLWCKLEHASTGFIGALPTGQALSALRSVSSMQPVSMKLLPLPWMNQGAKVAVPGIPYHSQHHFPSCKTANQPNVTSISVCKQVLLLHPCCHAAHCCRKTLTWTATNHFGVAAASSNDMSVQTNKAGPSQASRNQQYFYQTTMDRQSPCRISMTHSFHDRFPCRIPCQHL